MAHRIAQRGWLAPGVALAALVSLLIGLAAIGGCAQTPAGPAAARSPGLYDLAEDLTNIRSADGGVSLARGVLIEDDGPAFGIFDPLAEGGPDAIPGRPIRKSAVDVTDTPYWEPLSKTCMARKTLLVGALPGRSADEGQHAALKPRTAELLVYAARRPDAKLIVQVNGSRVEVKAEAVAAPASRPDKPVASTQPAGQAKAVAPRFEPPRWHRISISEADLRTGENEIVLSSDTDSPGWLLLIAPRDAYGRGTAGRRTFPGRSFRSDDSGRTWQGGQASAKLGRAGLAAGEYAVRLLLDQHVLTGQWTGPRADLDRWQAEPGYPIRRVVTFKSADGHVDQDVPAGCKVQWEFRSGSVQLGLNSAWGPWTKFAPDAAGGFHLDAVNNRYVQLRATLTTENPAVSPVVKGIKMALAEPAEQPVPPGRLRVTEWNNPRIVRSALDFTYETWPNAKLKLLDERFGLAAAIKPARTQFETAILTLDWLKATMHSHNVFVPSHTWNATDILSTQTTAPTEPLAYALVYCQALLAHGITARVFGEGSACEFWSTDFRKWVLVKPCGDILVDPLSWEYCIDAKTGVPVNGWELYQAHSYSFQEKDRRDEARLSNPAPLRLEELMDLESSSDDGLRVVKSSGVRPPGSGMGFRLPVLLIPRNNFASSDRLLPLTITEMPQPGWPELIVYDPSVAYLNAMYAKSAKMSALWSARDGDFYRLMGGKGKPEPGPKRTPEPPRVVSMSQLPHHLDRLCDLYPTLNTVQMEVQYGKTPGELWVYLDTETPGFETFQLNIDQAGFSSIPGANHFIWRLAPGPNSLQVRVRNKAGATGSISSIAVQYLPVAPPPKTGG